MSSKDTMEQIFDKVIFGTDGQSAKTTIKRLNALIASEREAAVREELEELKGELLNDPVREAHPKTGYEHGWNHGWDDCARHIDERLAKWGKHAGD